MKVKEPIKCELCGTLFVPRSSRQHYCRREITRKCLICGDEFVTNCSPDGKLVCSKPECSKQASQVSNPVTRKCLQCGEEFTTIFYKQMYCKQEKQKECPVCGKMFTYTCESFVPETCGDPQCQAKLIKEKRTESAQLLTRVCKWCGKEFHPKEWRDVYCSDIHYKECVVCGTKFEFDPRTQNADQSNTCSKECQGKLMSQNHDYAKGRETYKQVMLEKYGFESSLQVPEFREKGKKTNLEKYGSEWYTQTNDYKEKVKQTNLEKYGVEHHLQAQEVISKRIATCMQKYGKGNVLVSDSGKTKSRNTMLEKYGVEHSMQHPEFRIKAIKNARFSKLEKRICSLLDNYCIQYKHQYLVKQGDASHVFDFYLPDYNLLIDADGVYYHSYLNDPDGKKVREDYDEIRVSLIPENCRFYLIIEGQEDKQIKELVDLLESINGSLSQFDSNLFRWCRSIEFPYPEYSEERMNSDYVHLIQYNNLKYVPQCRLGQSVLKNFHKSIYYARVGSCKSPVEGWKDDNILKQVIRNRLIYQNNVDPSKILAGFNISKICPCVSTFNPVLAKYLTIKYLSEFDTIFDPFSGFSGRLIGVSSTNKSYIGQDLNEQAVVESNRIIDFLKLDNRKYSVSHKNILDSKGEFDCLLTCPPYNKKEIYSSESIFKTCDEWIQECLIRFKCTRYIFVVDSTDQFKDNIAEEIQSNSHLSKVSEYVVVLSN